MGLNVLIVDDSATMRVMVKRTLQMCGLSISNYHEAENGKEGLEVLDREWIDLIFLDINMPVMGGLEMIERLKDLPEHANTPVIVISTESSQTRIEEIQEKGVRFIHKPFKPEDVRKVMIDLVGEVQDADTDF